MAHSAQKVIEKTIFSEKRDEILRTAEKFGARNLRLFGSVVRGEARANSDVDLLVEFDPGRGLIDQIGLVLALRKLLERGVDVATPNTLHPKIKESVLQEAVPL